MRKLREIFFWGCRLWLVMTPLLGLSQVQTARNIAITSNCQGFYEYLPAGYPSSSTTYPLLVFLHGQGELGNGGSQLSLLLNVGPPMLISQGNFPDSFVVNGKTFEFIVISPQFVSWPQPSDVDAVISYAMTHYLVDPTRIYLTGMSMGGGGTWDYAGDTAVSYVQKLAAIVPVCGASYPSVNKARVIATANLPVWATHNLYDPTVPSQATIQWVNNINQAPAPNPPAKMTIFPVSGHDAWTTTYDPAFTDNGLNVYQWMLQFKSRSIVSLPVVLTSFDAVLGSDDQVNVHWKTSAEDNEQYYILERAGNNTEYLELDRIPAQNLSTGAYYSFEDRSPLPGINSYRLKQTDMDGNTSILAVKSIQVPGVQTGAVSLYPNPAKDHINLQLNFPQTGALTAKIIGVDGKTLVATSFEKKLGSYQLQIPLSQFPSGMYFISLNGQGIQFSKSFIKQ